MARIPRIDVAGIPQHVIQRGVNRSACFLDDFDREFYLASLLEAARSTICRIHAYVLMTNHVHLLVTGDQVGGISAMMQRLGRRYVRRFNTRHERTGTLWEGRFKSSLIDSDRYLLTCYRYIEMNPVRAHLVSQPREYPWSSVLFGKFVNYQRAAQGLWQGAVRREWPGPCQEPQRGHRPCAARPAGACRNAKYRVVSLGNIDILPAEHALYLAFLRALIVSELSKQDTGVHANAYGQWDRLVEPHATYQELSPDDRRRLALYRELLEQTQDPAEISSIRAHVNQGKVLGSPRFQHQIAALTGRCVTLKPMGRPQERHQSTQQPGKLT